MDHVSEIKNLVASFREAYRENIIESIAMMTLKNLPDGVDRKEYVAKHYTEAIQNSYSKWGQYFARESYAMQSKWSGGFSVTNMIEQIKREVIAEELILTHTSFSEIGKKMKEMVDGE